MSLLFSFVVVFLNIFCLNNSSVPQFIPPRVNWHLLLFFLIYYYFFDLLLLVIFNLCLILVRKVCSKRDLLSTTSGFNFDTHADTAQFFR